MSTTMSSQVSISDLTIEVVRKNIKHIHLAVYPPQGRVRVAAPTWTSDDAVRIFAIARLPWIRRQQSKFQQQERQTPREYVSGETHYLQGRRYRLRFIPSEHGAVELQRSLLLYAPAKSSVQERETLLYDWYRARLKSQIPELIVKWSALMDVSTVQWGVKRMKTKWGSCNAEARRIWLNLELAKKPYHCLEYVIVHELAHFSERHHNDRFRLLLDQHLPLWQRYRDELNQAPL
jgi:predicted metal-dependent hydrolase